MNLTCPSSGMYVHNNEQVYQPQNTPDPVDEFLAQFFNDVPITASTSSQLQAATYISVSSPAPTPIAAATPGPLPESLPHFTCHWYSPHCPPLLCGVSLATDLKNACAHFRHAHGIRGNDKVTVSCHWYGCNAAPMQKGSLIRHVMSVHLGLLRWRCDTCRRVFSRKGTIHACGDGDGP